MRLFAAFIVLSACPAICCQHIPQPITQVEACKGIGPGLQALSDDLATGKSTGMSLSGIDSNLSIRKIINVLDRQLANGLGSGSGASDAVNALKKAQKDWDEAKRQSLKSQ